MAAGRPLDRPAAQARRQVNVRLRRSDEELLQRICASTGLPAAQVIRMLLRMGARRLVLEEQARRREEANLKRYLEREERRWRPPAG